MSDDGKPHAIGERETILREIAGFHYEQYKAEAADRLRFQIEFAQAVLKSLYLVNGASIIALLTFIGNTDSKLEHQWLYRAFAAFSAGVVACLCAYFGAFFSQVRFMKTTLYQAWTAQFRMHGIEGTVDDKEFDRSFKWGNIAMYIGVVLAALSLACFIGGAFLALEAIL